MGAIVDLLVTINQVLRAELVSLKTLDSLMIQMDAKGDLMAGIISKDKISLV